MNARPLLERVALALESARLEAILFGNAAAALHGAPITTIDFDFLFRRTPMNLRKLKQFATQLGATVFRPYYPVSSLFRIVNDDIGLQVDFLSVAHGVRSFESLRSRATRVPFGDVTLLVASLQDIIKSKRAAGRERDRAVLPVLERTLNASKKTS
jgi:hypothetical protein